MWVVGCNRTQSSSSVVESQQISTERCKIQSGEQEKAKLGVGRRFLYGVGMPLGAAGQGQTVNCPLIQDSLGNHMTFQATYMIYFDEK